MVTATATGEMTSMPAYQNYWHTDLVSGAANGSSGGPDPLRNDIRI